MRVIAHVVILKKEEEPAPEAAVAVETAPAEPEVIKKGKKEEEGEEGAAEAAPAPKAEKPEKKGKEK
jgi:large subunit ribosomal protein L25